MDKVIIGELLSRRCRLRKKTIIIGPSVERASGICCTEESGDKK
jgi:hypothetical protein